MRQLTVSEASNDEMERQRFSEWFERNFREKIKDRPAMDQRGLQQVAWLGWQAALKSKKGNSINQNGVE